jgi:hypothetical protein
MVALDSVAFLPSGSWIALLSPAILHPVGARKGQRRKPAAGCTALRLAGRSQVRSGHAAGRSQSGPVQPRAVRAVLLAPLPPGGARLAASGCRRSLTLSDASRLASTVRRLP